MTKSLRWEIQALGVRLDKAASAEEQSRKTHDRAKTKQAHEVELRQIVLDIRKLITRIEDAVPLINLAITTSGARLSTTLPATVSPSRLLQASTFLTAGDTQYSMGSSESVQVGPAFTLSLYMLFSGHARRLKDSTRGARDTTWKEVIHKARVRIMRIPLSAKGEEPVLTSVENDGDHTPVISGGGKANEFNYHVEIIEDFDDDRVHSFEDDEAQPGPYGDIKLAGIRECLPIHQVAKIFYADTGKILNIGTQGETNNPVLLIKRDVDALPPRRMMDYSERTDEFAYEEPQELPTFANTVHEDDDEDSQDGIDAQLRRESSFHISDPEVNPLTTPEDAAWHLPSGLDPEWLALEVYTEAEDDESDDEQDLNGNEDSSYGSHRPSPAVNRSSEDNLTSDLSNLNIQSPSPAPRQVSTTPLSSGRATPFGPIRTSLSLLEMLIRLTALQQFQQASHLSIPDELLTFFLEESSTTGAGADGDERRRTRREARQKVGFDPYDESPIKRHGEDYQYQNQEQGYSRSGTPYSRSGTPYSPRGNTPYNEYESREGYSVSSPQWQQGSRNDGEEDWLRSRESPAPKRSGAPVPMPPSSPLGPYKPSARTGTSNRPLNRVQNERKVAGSPLGRGVSAETDSTLGTSPGSPTLVGRGGSRDAL